MNYRELLILCFVCLSADAAEADACEHSSSCRFDSILLYRQRCDVCHTIQHADRYSDGMLARRIAEMKIRAHLADGEAEIILSYLQKVNGS